MSTSNDTFVRGKSEEYLLSKEIENGSVGAEKMRLALTSLAQELQRFHTESIASNSKCEDDVDINTKLKLLQRKNKKKQHMINKLKSNIKRACLIVKTFATTKDVETANLSNRLKCAKHEAAALYSENKVRCSETLKLIKDIRILEQQMNKLREFIKLGYLKLEQIREEPHEELPVIMQLKKIIVCCGEYFADYTNEHARCIQLEQRNRFLTNKITFLENSFEIVTKELENLRRRKKSPKSNKNDHKDDCGGSKTFSRLFDLTSHFSLIRNLLKDQNNMLTDLRVLSDELNNNKL